MKQLILSLLLSFTFAANADLNDYDEERAVNSKEVVVKKEAKYYLYHFPQEYNLRLSLLQITDNLDKITDREQLLVIFSGLRSAFKQSGKKHKDSLVLCPEENRKSWNTVVNALAKQSNDLLNQKQSTKYRLPKESCVTVALTDVDELNQNLPDMPETLIAAREQTKTYATSTANLCKSKGSLDFCRDLRKREANISRMPASVETK